MCCAGLKSLEDPPHCPKLAVLTLPFMCILAWGATISLNWQQHGCSGEARLGPGYFVPFINQNRTSLREYCWEFHVGNGSASERCFPWSQANSLGLPADSDKNYELALILVISSAAFCGLALLPAFLSFQFHLGYAAGLLNAAGWLLFVAFVTGTFATIWVATQVSFGRINCGKEVAALHFGAAFVGKEYDSSLTVGLFVSAGASFLAFMGFCFGACFSCCQPSSRIKAGQNAG